MKKSDAKNSSQPTGPTTGSAAAAQKPPRAQVKTYAVVNQPDMLLGIMEFSDGTTAVIRPHKGRYGLCLKLKTCGQAGTWFDYNMFPFDIPAHLKMQLYRCYLSRAAQAFNRRASGALSALTATARDPYVSIEKICAAYREVNDHRALRTAESNHLGRILSKLQQLDAAVKSRPFSV